MDAAPFPCQIEIGSIQVTRQGLIVLMYFVMRCTKRTLTVDFEALREERRIK
jgi:hypothetical protein